MGTAPRLALPSPIRALLALLLAGAFGFRVVASPVAWGCLTAEPAAHGTHHPQSHEPGHRHHGAGVPACECIAHAAGTGLTVKPAELARTVLLSAPSGARPSVEDARVVTSPSHLLPFSVGPPSLPAV
jgi:hypothetical protein